MLTVIKVNGGMIWYQGKGSVSLYVVLRLCLGSFKFVVI